MKEKRINEKRVDYVSPRVREVAVHIDRTILHASTQNYINKDEEFDS